MHVLTGSVITALWCLIYGTEMFVQAGGRFKSGNQACPQCGCGGTSPPTPTGYTQAPTTARSRCDVHPDCGMHAAGGDTGGDTGGAPRRYCDTGHRCAPCEYCSYSQNAVGGACPGFCAASTPAPTSNPSAVSIAAPTAPTTASTAGPAAARSIVCGATAEGNARGGSEWLRFQVLVPGVYRFDAYDTLGDSRVWVLDRDRSVVLADCDDGQAWSGMHACEHCIASPMPS